MDKYRKEVGIEILVGLFMFAVLLALGIFTIVLSHEKLTTATYRYEFVFPEVGGLREGDNVYVRGMNVGRVRQIQLEDGHVRVYVSVDVPLHFRRGYKVEVADASMLGGKYLKIYEGPPDAPELGENVTLLGSPPVDLIGELASTAESLRRLVESAAAGQGTLGKLLTDDTLYRKLTRAGDDLARVLDRIASGEGTLGKLVMADDGRMYDDLRTMLADLRQTADALAQGKGLLGKLLTADDGAYDDLRASLASIRKVTGALGEGKGTLGRLLSPDDTVYEDLSRTLAAARRIAESIDKGEGTLGKLVRDAKLYDEATLLVEDVRAAVDDLREAAPVTSFGSVLFGAF